MDVSVTGFNVSSVAVFICMSFFSKRKRTNGWINWIYCVLDIIQSVRSQILLYNTVLVKD